MIGKLEMQQDEKQNENIEGIVESVLFTNPSNGYIVLELDIGDKIVTVVGELGNIEEGEELSLTGKYVTLFYTAICSRAKANCFYGRTARV